MELHEHLHVRDFIHFGYDSTHCPQWYNKHFLSCTTIEVAKEILKLLKIVPSNVCIVTANAKGILIGSQSTRRACPSAPDACLAQYLQQHFMVENWRTYVYTHIKKCMLHGILYEIGDNFIVEPDDVEQYDSMKATIT